MGIVASNEKSRNRSQLQCLAAFRLLAALRLSCRAFQCYKRFRREVIEMIRNNPLGVILCLPLAAGIFSQGSLCNECKSSANSNNSTSQTQSSAAPKKAEGQVTGLWGGDHISMEVTEGGATIVYDCARGSITEKIVPDRSGKFAARGFHVKGHPGPTRLGEDTKGEPANYDGSLEGETMTLTVTLRGTNEMVGNFTLTYGKMGRIRRCG